MTRKSRHYLNTDRILTWDQIDPAMVSESGGKQVFHAGTYEKALDDDSVIKVVCKDGSDTPEVTRESSIGLFDLDYFYVNGKRYSWNDLIDEKGNKMSISDMHSGKWKTGTGPNAGEVDLELYEDGDSLLTLLDLQEAVREGVIEEPPY